MSRWQGMKRYGRLVGQHPVACLTYQAIGITGVAHILQTASKESHREISIIIVQVDGGCAFVDQTVANSYLADAEWTVFGLGCHELMGIDAHISLGATHQYLTVGRKGHGITIEVELRHAYIGLETATNQLNAAPMALLQDAYYSTAGGAEPVGALVVAHQSLDDIAVATDIAEGVALRVEHRHALRMDEHHESFVPVGLHVDDHLTEPLLCLTLIAESHTTGIGLQIVGPQTIHRTDKHSTTTVIAYRVATDIFAIVGGHHMGALILRVKDNCLAYG